MEVHQHSHGPRKKWIHYFWEFLMLFLAVFCGFLAEYQLEHKIEKDRARQYIRSFYDDLKTDTAQMRRLIDRDRLKLAAFEQIGTCYDTVSEDPKKGGCLIQMVRNSLSFVNFVNTERTLQQLKNAGGMRMLKKRDADSIYAYDNSLRRYLNFETTLFQERQTNLRNLYLELLSFHDMLAFRSWLDSTALVKPERLIFTTRPEDLNRLFNQLSEYAAGVRNRIQFLTGLHAAAERMLSYFRSEYHLE